MSYIIDRTIQSYIDEERERCRGLVERLIDEPDFLLYCINAPVYPTEDLASHRQRFNEFDSTTVADDFEDLM